MISFVEGPLTTAKLIKLLIDLWFFISQVKPCFVLFDQRIMNQNQFSGGDIEEEL